MSKILVTGATGTVGAEVVRALVKKGETVHVAARDAKKAEGRFPGATPVSFDWDKPDTIAAAVKGVDAVFLLTPFTDIAVGYAKTLVEAAKAAGVKKLVKLSAVGAETEGIQLAKWHRDAERAVEGSGLAWVTLRPSFFMSNFVAFYPPDREGVIYLPTGNGKASWVDVRDIADVAAEVLTRPDWDGQALTLTGAQALSVADVATVLSKHAGRPIRHVDVSVEAARGAMAGLGMEAWMVDAMLDLHMVLKNDWAAGITSVVEDVTGHGPRRFDAFAKENASAFATTSGDHEK
jgi:uncharacterized protein YbjT (DUF2867 family)